MFEPKDDQVEAPVIESAPVATEPVADTGDYGIFNGASITVEDGIVTVTIPLANGENITKVSVPIASAWIVDNVASKLFEEAKKYQP